VWPKGLVGPLPRPGSLLCLIWAQGRCDLPIRVTISWCNGSRLILSQWSLGVRASAIRRCGTDALEPAGFSRAQPQKSKTVSSGYACGPHHFRAFGVCACSLRHFASGSGFRDDALKGLFLKTRQPKGQRPHPHHKGVSRYGPTKRRPQRS